MLQQDQLAVVLAFLVGAGMAALPLTSRALAGSTAATDWWRLEASGHWALIYARPRGDLRRVLQEPAWRERGPGSVKPDSAKLRLALPFGAQLGGLAGRCPGNRPQHRRQHPQLRYNLPVFRVLRWQCNGVLARLTAAPGSQRAAQGVLATQ